ncbi:NAD(P)-binding protein [Dothidotthia symphoricarpi CBS 119687]|uniref:NAD(P)-binding protein n=1 Tax=Dothidotthia symphoricarpi CBS 119687 TaxID=1392245 RepID=A0A6A6AI96_9PLEO|nr:NAD(P)-binding protein [Dothidotthia symphoricarpi CBS 119687]KAF2131530.1 NAD(P)-binding protein [Dothidotthia symphoricarpi CBS 119687]
MASPRHVLITGGSRGIGLSIAQLFAKNNFRCTLLSRSESALKAAVATLQPLRPLTQSSPQPSTASFPHHTHAYIASSLTSPTLFSASTDSASDSITSHLPIPRLSPANDASRIDILVNCAGITQASLFQTMSHAGISEIVDTNLTSLMVGTKFFLRQGYFRKAKAKKERDDDERVGGPVIINVASLLGLQGGYGAVAYAASKAGVLGFTRALAAEYVSHGVRVNAIVPGYVETDMTKDLPATQLNQRIPLGRLGKPSEIAQAAFFLAENQYAHNCVINLDGGLSAV